jgi:hypothetical protein
MYRKKLTADIKCPKCQTNESERISRSLFNKLIHFNNSIKKFKCLKCWEIYYVNEKLKKSN